MFIIKYSVLNRLVVDRLVGWLVGYLVYKLVHVVSCFVTVLQMWVVS